MSAHCEAHSGVVTRLDGLDRRLDAADRSAETQGTEIKSVKDLLHEHLVETRAERRWRRLLLPLVIGLVAGGGGGATAAALFKAAAALMGGQ